MLDPSRIQRYGNPYAFALHSVLLLLFIAGMHARAHGIDPELTRHHQKLHRLPSQPDAGFLLFGPVEAPSHQYHYESELSFENDSSQN